MLTGSTSDVNDGVLEANLVFERAGAYDVSVRLGNQVSAAVTERSAGD